MYFRRGLIFGGVLLSEFDNISVQLSVLTLSTLPGPHHVAAHNTWRCLDRTTLAAGLDVDAAECVAAGWALQIDPMDLGERMEQQIYLAVVLRNSRAKLCLTRTKNLKKI